MAPSLSASLVVPSLMILKLNAVFSLLIFLGPVGEVGDEFLVGDDEHLAEVLHRGEVIDDVLEHRLARDRQKRLGLVERERVKSGGVAGGENENLHRTLFLTG